jgi:hypothetical protein
MLSRAASWNQWPAIDKVIDKLFQPFHAVRNRVQIAPSHIDGGLSCVFERFSRKLLFAIEVPAYSAFL